MLKVQAMHRMQAAVTARHTIGSDGGHGVEVTTGTLYHTTNEHMMQLSMEEAISHRPGFLPYAWM